MFIQNPNQRNNPNFLRDVDDERYRPYLRSNDLPGEDVILELQPLLQRLGDQRRGIQRRIDVLNLTLQALHRSYNDVDRVLYCYKSLLSPIRRLPDDVLGEIFLWTLPSTRNAIPVLSEFPLLLTLVCKKWRIVAESTPRLWSNLHIILPFQDTDTTDNDADFQTRRSYVSAVKNWLHLSGGTPLSLSISPTSSYPFPTSLNPFVEALLVSIVQQASRWREIDLVGSSIVIRFINKKIAMGSAERQVLSLRRLRFRLSHYFVPADDSSSSDIPLLCAASSLRELSLNLSSASSYSSLVPALRTRISWRTLTRLAVHQCFAGPQWLFDILSQCEQLEALLLDIPDAGVGGPGILIPSIYLPKLKTLSLKGGNDDVDNFCGYLETPILTDFSFYPTYGRGTYIAHQSLSISPLRKFLQRCGDIKSMTVSPALIDGEDLPAIFETVPQVTSLILDHTESPFTQMDGWDPPRQQLDQLDFHLESFLLQVASESNQCSAVTTSSFQPLLPSLQSFSLLCLSVPPSAAESIIAFCKSRLPKNLTAGDSVDPPFTPLKHIKMTLSKLQSTVDIGEDLTRYAESIGKKLGDELVLDITYPWGDEIDHWSPSTHFNPRTDLVQKTDRTWADIDA